MACILQAIKITSPNVQNSRGILSGFTAVFWKIYGDICLECGRFVLFSNVKCDSGNEALDNVRVILPFICSLSFRRCDLVAKMCVTRNVRLPMLKKMKSPRRPKTEHVNLDEKIHFIPGRAQDGDTVDDDVVLWVERPWKAKRIWTEQMDPDRVTFYRIGLNQLLEMTWFIFFVSWILVMLIRCWVIVRFLVGFVRTPDDFLFFLVIFNLS